MSQFTAPHDTDRVEFLNLMANFTAPEYAEALTDGLAEMTEQQIDALVERLCG